MNTREAPPHNIAQAFEEDQRARSVAGRAALGLNGNGTHQLPTGASPLRFTEPVNLEGVVIPARRWMVDQIVPMSNVTMISGDGGLGKSLISQQLMTACALGKPWLGQPVTKCRAMAIYCEDDNDELHRRQTDINDHYGVTFADLADMRWHSRAGADSVLMSFGQNDYGIGKPTALLGQIKEAALAFGAKLLVLDSLHDLFQGNENHRGAARSFISALRGIAIAMDGAVVLCAHPSMSGMNTGTGASGSTAWNNAVRSRLYLTRPKQDEEADQDNNVRFLRGMKANYSSTGGKIEMSWAAGVFVAKERPAGVFATIEASQVRRAFLACLDAVTAQGRYVSDAPTSPMFAPKVFKSMPEAEGHKQAALKKAMDDLFSAGEIRMGDALTSSRHKTRCILRARVS